MVDGYPDNAVAVVGMACKFPGADSLEEFWQLLDEGRSMCEPAPEGRFATTENRRHQEKSIYNGNWVSDIDAFDHKFFRKSSREAASMDPQQRLLLQVAYHALESSGYFGPGEQNTDVGCYVGVCASDYNDNVAAHPPNAFSTLGTLRAFLTGKISHYFGWTGPSVSFDTACSSSMVAIDAACNAIQLGNCYSAVAGGVSLFTSPYFFQNLSGASFLSATGPTKSFDADADGYCRGEGVGLVVLKKLSNALADGDNIQGVIMSTAVAQSSNLVPITVPYSPSQTSLYRRVLKQANVSPEEVTYLEAHGTGTRIGDPQEYEGIREVFGCEGRREKPFHFASVKGNIGHTEGASGVAGLIKTILMMQRSMIPRQGSFKKLNPKITLEPNVNIPTSTVPWNAQTLIACVNNYGAGGSIAAAVVKEAPKSSTQKRASSSPSLASQARYPIFLSAHSPQSLSEQASRLRTYINHLPPSSSRNTLAEVAFNLADRQNRTLPNIVAATVASMSELDDQLRIVSSVPTAGPAQTAVTKPKPIVLAFGGQTNRSVGLNPAVTEASGLFREYLDECDRILKSLGSNSIYPGIFESNPRDDIVGLQTMQFALQYASAKTWMDSGLRVDAIVGHSFGQLTAMTVAGILTLEDGLKLVHGRASLMQQEWGPERGEMVALDADLQTTEDLIANYSSPNDKLEIACFNGPKSHVVVGSNAAINGLVDKLRLSSAVKYKKLNVTHGFHSRFTDAILPALESLADGLTYASPQIPLETCSDGSSWAAPSGQLIAQHTRIPVYFSQAISRIVQRLGSCTWLEAGSNSSITSMARRAVGDDVHGHSFIPLNLSSPTAIGSLADATVQLWRNGHHRVQFWPFHRVERASYTQLSLPPFPFEKTSHWLEWVEEKPAAASVEVKQDADKEDINSNQLLVSPKWLNATRQSARIRVNTRSDEWQRVVQGHAVLNNPLCPAPLYLELVARATKILGLGDVSTFHALEIVAPLGLSQDVDLALQLDQQTNDNWSFSFASQPLNAPQQQKPAVHGTGSVTIASDNNSTKAEFDRTARLLPYSRVKDLLSQEDGEAMYGSLVYKVFNRVVQYDDYYKGVSRVVAKAGQVAADVVLRNPPLSWAAEQVSNPLALDNFLQVAGLHVNSLRDCADTDVYVCTKVDRLSISPSFFTSSSQPAHGSWGVFSNLNVVNDKHVENDVYVFDATTGELVLMVVGAQFSRVLISSLSRVLSRANPSTTSNTATTTTTAASIPVATSFPEAPFAAPQQPAAAPSSAPKKTRTVRKQKTPGIEKELGQLLSKITDVPEHEFRGQATLEDLGIDSLMITEIVSEISTSFGINIPQEDLADLLTFESLSTYLTRRGARGNGPVEEEEIVEEDDSPPPNIAAAVPKAASPDTQKDDNLRLQLAQLVSSHLDVPASNFARTTNLADEGLDSLLCMELASDIERSFGVRIDVTLLTTESTFGDLADMTFGKGSGATLLPSSSPSSSGSESLGTYTPADTETDYERISLPDNGSNPQQAFEKIQFDDHYQKETGFTGYWKNVYPTQQKLVLAYVVETFRDLGIPLDALQSGQTIPLLPVLPKHNHLRNVFYEVLRDGHIADYTGKEYIRSEKPIDPTPSTEFYSEIIRAHPQHASEHELLHLCGSLMSKLVTGERDPLHLLFGTKKNKELLEDVYSNGPIYKAMSQLLADFLKMALSNRSGPVRILELGAGTGSTTKWVVDALSRAGISFNYTFTDISTSLVAAGRRKFSKYRDSMEFQVLDIEKDIPPKFFKSFDTILSTNCIHATSNLPNSLTHIYQMIKPGGFLSLVEFTRNMFWFDMVFGLLEGWWLFNDGRQHVLADEVFWERCMRNVGFQHVAMTEGTAESRLVQIITGFTNEATEPPRTESWIERKKDETEMETVAFNTTPDGVILRADIYYPSESSKAAAEAVSSPKKWPVGVYPY
jgi:acyl transferase domain-containing protein/SAM-dependent methyltransferase/aryl carrier-like protein